MAPLHTRVLIHVIYVSRHENEPVFAIIPAWGVHAAVAIPWESIDASLRADIHVDGRYHGTAKLSVARPEDLGATITEALQQPDPNGSIGQHMAPASPAHLRRVGLTFRDAVLAETDPRRVGWAYSFLTAMCDRIAERFPDVPKQFKEHFGE